MSRYALNAPVENCGSWAAAVCTGISECSLAQRSPCSAELRKASNFTAASRLRLNEVTPQPAYPVGCRASPVGPLGIGSVVQDPLGSPVARSVVLITSGSWMSSEVTPEVKPCTISG